MKLWVFVKNFGKVIKYRVENLLKKRESMKYIGETMLQSDKIFFSLVNYSRL